MYDKLIVVTRRTRLDDLIARFNSRGQARFYIEHAGGDFGEYEREHETYQRALDTLRRTLDFGVPRQFLDRSMLPTYTFGPGDVVVPVGQDGLVANTAKYAGRQPIVGVNPDPARFDGILLPFGVDDARPAVGRVLEGEVTAVRVTMAEALLADGQRLLAFNDLFIGARSHVSARYRLTVGDRHEPQSSSGVLVSTGAGSTGWMSSVFNMGAGIARFTGGQGGDAPRLGWDDERLLYAVREPFVSRTSAAGLVAGLVPGGGEIVLESLMPTGGVIFSDGIEADFLEFNAGAVAHVRAAAHRAVLVTRGAGRGTILNEERVHVAA